ncbi:hypothetical protein PUR61_38650 [Streptomyces sp. BE20]|uniref:hypothetical protein n=1 Tax=Streptomyces sp. BE20 TaxID=3002525 RepID=UPI002E75FA6E|nr:hypothetical protein [Streptomyces sp. BE20]MEE1828057.1 hypothetical protein [Streptomyces sp. BE20]
MSGDIPVTLVLSSCPHDEVRPLLVALDAHDFDTTCNNHDVDACVQLGTRWTDWEAYTEDLHALYEDLRRAAPHAGLAVVGGASESGPGILRLNHPVLGDYPRRVPTQDDRPAPLFTPTQVRSILDGVAGKPNRDQLVSLALGEPWSEQFHPLPDPYSCQTVATADQLAADAMTIHTDIAHGHLAVHQLLRDPRGTLWATATHRAGDSVILKHEGLNRRVVERCRDRHHAADRLKTRLRR